ncbi:MAG: archaeosortase A [Candidatus Thermoplasmatota archaeon]|nr:archaeosortase A [Candidatus Thermoplasmatota archaeon]
MSQLISALPLFSGLVLLGCRYFIKRRENKILSFLGYFLFSAYWLLQVPYFIKVTDWANAIFCSLALPFFTYIAYYELVLFELKKEREELRFLAGWCSFAGLIYFSIEKISVLAEFLIKLCAEQSVWLLNIFGYSYYVGKVTYYPEISFPIEGTAQEIHLILACTGLQSIAIFVGAILCVKAELKRKFYAFLATAPVIWVLNLVRNSCIIYSDGIGLDANFIHNSIGKLGSLLALIALALVTFKLLPEVYTNIIALLELKKNKFFRDPERKIGGGIVAPADGKIIELEEAEKTKISIFMRLWDVHVNRVPLACKVLKIVRKHGKYYPAYSNKAVENERVEFELETEIGVVKLVQLAGIFARRIECWVKENDILEKGQRIGMIRFGSRVELYLPAERIDLKVKLGDIVIAGESTIATIKE